MSTAAEVAMLIKLGGDVDISEHGLTINDMIPFFESATYGVAESIYKTVNVTRLIEPVTFRLGILDIKEGTILKSEEKK